MDAAALCALPGIAIRKVIRERFKSTVTPLCKRHAFFLVASFGRSKIKLTPLSVGAILQATLGGVDLDFDVLQLADRVFSFSVASKWVGFHLFNLRSFGCTHFKVFFHLWGSGGPDWKREWSLFCKEEDASWSVVGRSASSPARRVSPDQSFADVVRSVPLTGANRVPINGLRPKSLAVSGGKNAREGSGLPIGSLHPFGWL